MRRIIFRLLSALSYYIRAKTVYQVHGPFLSALLAATIEDRRHYYAFDKIERVRSLLEQSDQLVTADVHGTGASRRKRNLSFGQWVRRSALSPHWGRLLFRIALHFKPRTILELGTGAGISTAYLASACPSATLDTIDAHVQRCQITARLLSELDFKKVTVLNELLPEALQLRPPGSDYDLVYIDADHTSDGMSTLFEAILPLVHDNSILIFDDIRWSTSTLHAWKRISRHQRVRLSVDCFQFGLVAFSPNILQKQSFTIIRHRWKPWTMLMGW